jgi:osmoprotectant transport system permease protein
MPRRGDLQLDQRHRLHPRPVRQRLLPQPLGRDRQLRREQRLLPQLDRPPPRPLRLAVLAAPVPGLGVGGHRLRDRVRARPRRPRRRWLVSPITQVTGILYTIPSLSFFFLLLPITGRGNTTALIALTAYTLLILFRNIVDGLDGVPEESRDAGRGMGFTARQLLWRVELPLALPAIMAGLRIAATTTVGLAALATYAGAGGLGDQMSSQKEFISNVAVGGALCVVMAVGLDAILLLAQRLLTPWSRARAA